MLHNVTFKISTKAELVETEKSGSHKPLEGTKWGDAGEREHTFHSKFWRRSAQQDE